MKYFVLLAALLLFSGCDIFGIHVPSPGRDTITYRVESDTTSPRVPLLVTYYFGPHEYNDRVGIEITEYPWEITIPNYDGIKMIYAHSFEDNVDISIHHNGRPIASAVSNYTGGKHDVARWVGTMAHAESYEIETIFAFSGAHFTLEYGGISRSINIEMSDRPEHRQLFTFKPGDVIRVTKDNVGTEGSFTLVSRTNQILASYIGFGTFEYEIHFGETG